MSATAFQRARREKAAREVTMNENLVVPQISEESQESEVEEKTIDKMTVAELKEYANQHEIDLGEATKKDDILMVIKGAESNE
ncbi:hypothetical protein [Brevibacillus laterosporus]|uniref:hypothetical protein n=1 Tax=Brevibacillus laterosporus TaxID=1465 RepID=UPI00215CB61F|nr:hypothetical protein [Brevibacillus laterosporus]MCR8994483.1 hypothetical protein [Brevibacillus laterosporus]